MVRLAARVFSTKTEVHFRRIYDIFEAKALLRETYYAFPDPPMLQSFDPEFPMGRPNPKRNTSAIAAFHAPNSVTQSILGEGENSSTELYLQQSSKDAHGSESERNSAVLSERDNNGASSSQGGTGRANNNGSMQVEPQIFAGLSVYISSTLKIREQMAMGLKNRVERAGAKSCFIAGTTNDEESREGDLGDVLAYQKELGKADYVICYKRTGWEFWKVRLRIP